MLDMENNYPESGESENDHNRMNTKCEGKLYFTSHTPSQ